MLATLEKIISNKILADRLLLQNIPKANTSKFDGRNRKGNNKIPKRFWNNWKVNFLVKNKHDLGDTILKWLKYYLDERQRDRKFKHQYIKKIYLEFQEDRY